MGRKALSMVKIAVVLLIQLTITGPFTGPAALFGPLARRGVFESRCKTANTTEVSHEGEMCADQAQAIEQYADFALSLSNFACAGWGLVHDAAGPRLTGLVSVGMWMVAKSLAGVAPASGMVWAAMESTAAVSTLGVFTAVAVGYLRDAVEYDEGRYAFWSYIAAASWDVAVMANIVLALLFGADRVPLWGGYAIYGCGVGIPAFVCLYCWRVTPPVVACAVTSEAVAAESAAADSHSVAARVYEVPVSPVGAYDSFAAAAVATPVDSAPVVATTVLTTDSFSGSRRMVHGLPSSTSIATRPAAITGSAQEPLLDSCVKECDAPPQQPQPPVPVESAAAERTGFLARPWGFVRAAVTHAWPILTAPSFWAFCLHCGAVVSLGYFLIANTGSIAKRHGLIGDEVTRAKRVTTITMSLVGLSNALPGQVVQRLGRRRGISACVVVQQVLLVLVVLVLLVPSIDLLRCAAERSGLGGALDGAGALYVSFGMMFVWRVWGFGLGFSFLAWRFAPHTASLGLAYGVAFMFGGGTSLVVGSVASSLFHADPERNFAPLLMALGAMAFVIDCVLIAVVCRAPVALDADPSGDVDHTGTIDIQ